MKFKWQNILVVVGLFIAVVLLMDFNRRMEELSRLNTKLESVRAEGTSIMQTQEALLIQVAYATSDDAVEKWAYENKWVRQGEKVIALVPTGEASTVTTAVPPVAAPTESQPNWRIWWNLFFGAN